MPHPSAIAFHQKYPDCGITLEQFDEAFTHLHLLRYRESVSFEKADACIHAVVDFFKADGLTLNDYLAAAIKKPQFFYQSPANVASNINTVSDEFKEDGLTRRDYLSAAVRRPQLFYQSPKTIISNINGVVNEFKEQGLSRRSYLVAAVALPQLFYQSPKTINTHIKILLELQQNSLLFFGQKNTPTEFWERIQNEPRLLVWSSENLLLRGIYAALFDDGKKKAINLSRKAIEDELRLRASNRLGGYFAPGQETPNLPLAEAIRQDLQLYTRLRGAIGLYEGSQNQSAPITLHMEVANT